MYQAFVQKGARHGYISVRFHKHGMILSESALQMIGEDKNKVMLFFDADRRRIGFWFHKGGISTPYPPQHFYSVSRFKAAYGGRISAKPFFDEFQIEGKLNSAGRRIFLLHRESPADLPPDVGTDFYYVELSLAGTSPEEEEHPAVSNVRIRLYHRPRKRGRPRKAQRS